MIKTRTEADGLGALHLPAEALYGVNTVRASRNFKLAGRPLSSERVFVRALADIKASAACANGRLSLLTPELVSAIVGAADEMAAGKLDAWLVVDMLEGAGGTSFNMNVNEVLANRTLQSLGRPLGDYTAAHPNDHLNRSQSTNDVIPTALKLACRTMLADLAIAAAHLSNVIEEKAKGCAEDLRLGRTCLQDAQPMMLGQAIRAWAGPPRRMVDAAERWRQAFCEVPLGATAIGTGFGAPGGYRAIVLEELSRRTEATITGSVDLFDGLANADDYCRLSGDLKAYAAGLNKIANDLMILSSGPDGGLGELALPALQAGSSIMPGKVNPVAPMAVAQGAFAVFGHDTAITAACAQGQLEINPYEPLIASALFDQIRLLTRSSLLLADHCILGLEPRRDRLRANLVRSAAPATALLPMFGYDEASALVKAARSDERTFLEAAVAEGHFTAEAVEGLLRKSTGTAS